MQIVNQVITLGALREMRDTLNRDRRLPIVHVTCFPFNEPRHNRYFCAIYTQNG